MDGKITGESEVRVGLHVTDNNGKKHEIEMEFDGEIKHHEQVYANATHGRTPEEDKHVGHARGYAQYYVYRERGYDTLDESRNPDRLMSTAAVVAALSSDEFEDHFGDLYQQLRSHGGHAEPVVGVMDAVKEDSFFVYAKEIYLGDEGEMWSQLESASLEQVEGYLETVGERLSEESLGIAGLIDELPEIAAEHGLDDVSVPSVDPTQLIEATPPPYPRWRIGTQIHEDHEQKPDLDRKADCRLEIVPYVPDSLEAFQQYVLHHIKCQIRDCFTTIGVVPPEPFRVQGPGLDLVTMQYQHYPALQPYHDPDADIDWENV